MIVTYIDLYCSSSQQLENNIPQQITKTIVSLPAYINNEHITKMCALKAVNKITKFY